MKDGQLERLLRGLPREQAPPDFTRQVLAATGAQAARRAGPAARGARLPTWGLAAAAAAALLLVPAGIWIYNTTQRAALADEFRALQMEHQRLTAELQRLRLQMDAQQTVLYLGSDERADYVLDLRRLVREQVLGAPTSAFPAGHPEQPGPPDQPAQPEQPDPQVHPVHPGRLPAVFTGGSI